MKHDLIERMKKCCESAEWQQKNRTELLKTLSEFLKNAEPYDLSTLNEYIDDKKPRDGLNLTAETIAMLGATNFKFDFMDGRPVFDEPEQSAAEKWSQKVFNDLKTSGGHAAIHVKLIAMQAHEAGQAHSAGVERAKRMIPVRKLLEIANNLQPISGLYSKQIYEVLENIDTTQHGGLPEKPSWAEDEPENVGFISETKQMPLSGKAKISICTDIKTKLRIMDRVKITPIKD